MDIGELVRQRNNFLTYIVGGLITAAGLLLNFASTRWLTSNADFQAAAKSLGSALIITGALSLTWDFVSRRALAREVLQLAHSHEAVDHSGIVDVYESFAAGPPWNRLFTDATRLDLVFSYAETWRNAHRTELQELAKRKCRVRILVPDPEDDMTMSELAWRFSEDGQILPASIDKYRQKIRECIADYSGMFSKGKGKVEVYCCRFCPLYSMYRFDNYVIWATYNHARGRAEVPVFLLKSPGTVFKHLENDFDEIVAQKNPLVRCAWPG